MLLTTMDRYQQKFMDETPIVKARLSLADADLAICGGD
jgi:hypothetical protein